MRSIVDSRARTALTSPRSAVLKNATVKLLTLLFFHSYPLTSPTFFSHFIALLRPAPGAPLNPHTTDLLLRLLHEVSTEISDAQLRLNKTVLRLNKDGELRDAVRARDAIAIAGAVWEVLGEAIEGLGSEGEGIKGERAREIAMMGMKVIGDYVCEFSVGLVDGWMELGAKLDGWLTWHALGSLGRDRKSVV